MNGKETRRKRPRRKDLEAVPAGYKGLVYELWFENALMALEKEGEITRWWQTLRFSEENHDGIDFFVEVDNLTIPLQVTSTHNEAKRKRRQFRERDISVPVLFLVTREGQRKGELKSVEFVKEQILETIAAYQERPNF